MDPTSTSTMSANVNIKMNAELAGASRTNHVKGSWIGKKISNLQSKMYEELREYACKDRNRSLVLDGKELMYNYNSSSHILGWFAGGIDVGLDIVKYPLLTIEHLVKAILEPLGVIIKMSSREKIFKSCTLGSAASHLGFGIKGALSTASTPLFILQYVGNVILTARKPGESSSLWERIEYENMKAQDAIKKKYN